MNKLTKAWAFAGLSYDEDKFVDHVRELFDIHAHVITDKNMTFFSGVVPDSKNDTLYIFNRGTDGKNWFGNFESWANNFRVMTGPDGVHNGFQDIGNRVIDKFKSYIYKFSTVVISGQSKGAGITPYEACLVAENFKNVKHVYGYSFAAPPTGNQTFYDRCQQHINNKTISLYRYNNKGDYIDSEALRGGILGAVDVGEEITLPVIVGFDQTVSLHLIQHSNRITNAALMQWYAINRERAEEIYILAEIGKRLIN